MLALVSGREVTIIAGAAVGGAVCVGVVIGTLLAIGVSKLVAATTPLPAAITLWVVFLGLGFVLSIGLFFGIYPASKAAKLNPIEALRYE